MVKEAAGGGFRVAEGAYETYARGIDPLSEEIAGAARSHLAPHAQVAGAGFSEVGHEAGLADAYQRRMTQLQEDIQRLGGHWGGTVEAARQTGVNYETVEADHEANIRAIAEDVS